MRAENLVFRRCRIRNSHGIGIGSETSAGIRNVTIEDMDLRGGTIGLRIKSRRGRGGLMEMLRPAARISGSARSNALV